MEYDFVNPPVVSAETKNALERRKHLESIKGTVWEKYPPFEGGISNKPLTPEETKLLQQYDEEQAEFDSRHYYFEESPTDDQRITYIIGHRGGDEFPGFKGSVSYEELASGVLSQLRAGTYKRGSGAAYSLAEFENNVRKAYEKELKFGWLRKN